MFRIGRKKKRKVEKPVYSRQHILYMNTHIPICFEPDKLGDDLIYIDTDSDGPVCRDCSAELERYSMKNWIA